MFADIQMDDAPLTQNACSMPANPLKATALLSGLDTLRHVVLVPIVTHDQCDSPVVVMFWLIVYICCIFF